MDQATVHAAIQTLRQQGQQVSVRNVHRLTGGSFRDISRLLRQPGMERPDEQSEARSEAWQPVRDREQRGAVIILLRRGHATLMQHRDHPSLFLVRLL